MSEATKIGLAAAEGRVNPAVIRTLKEALSIAKAGGVSNCAVVLKTVDGGVNMDMADMSGSLDMIGALFVGSCSINESMAHTFRKVPEDEDEDEDQPED